MPLEFQLPNDFELVLSKHLRRIYSETIEQSRRDFSFNTKFVNLKEACGLVGISRNTLDKWINNGLSVFVVEGKTFVKVTELYDYIEKHRV